MRKVKFKRWIKAEYLKADGIPSQKVPNTGCYEPEFNNDGLFHCWGTTSQDSGEQMVMDTLAIIELPDGNIEEVAPSMVKFIDPPQDLELCYSSEGIKPLIYFKDPQDGK